MQLIGVGRVWGGGLRVGGRAFLYIFKMLSVIVRVVDMEREFKFVFGTFMLRLLYLTLQKETWNSKVYDMALY